MTKVTIFGSGTNRSVRPVWTAKELGLTFELVTAEELTENPELKSLHPQRKIPSALVGDLEMFESSVISEYLCDSVPGNNLLAPSGTKERLAYSQWVSFSQSEIEAYLWHNFLLDRSEKGIEFFQETSRLNQQMALAGLRVLEEHLQRSQYLCGDEFGLTDIVVGWTVNWARRASLISSFEYLNNYIDSLFDRPHCILAR